MVAHASGAIALVHEYIRRLLAELCPEEQVRKNLWDTLLVHRLCDAYRRAMSHARFFLAIERGGKPITFNHYFNSTLQKKRTDRLCKAYEGLAIHIDGSKYVPLASMGQRAVDMDNAQQTCEDILDALSSYYKVARKRFVDVVCQQVVYHFLLEGKDSPLRVFGPDLIMGLAPEQLELIAGEDAETKRQRQGVEREVERLQAAMRVIRG